MSISDAVTKLVDSVIEGLHGRARALGVFIDLSKAFDCVHYGTRLDRLGT